ncbi:MAG: c-type cytochrome [Acidobacteriota bacterium]
MRSTLGVVAIAAASLLTAGLCFAADPPAIPFWAYGIPPGPMVAATPAAPDPSIRHLPGNSLEFTRAQISNGFGPADWYPGDHPQMPPIVAKGKEPAVRACSLCHYPNGKGRAENAGVSGLPVSYFIQQMLDFRDDKRKSAETRKANTKAMAVFAKNMTDDEIKQAAEYFAAIKWTPWIKVIESKTAPKTKVNNGLFLAEGDEKEPLGNRIVEVPVNAEATEILRDPHSGFIAYVPVGSLKKGEALAKSKQCALCHGEGLKGLGPVPPLAGRSPSYLMRQMYDMEHGFRDGLWTGLMKPVVAGLSDQELLELSAYVAAQAP